MTTFNYPKKSAFSLAQKMRQFRAKTEETAQSELNHNADHDRAEVVRQIDWFAFNKVIEELEFCYNADQNKIDWNNRADKLGKRKPFPNIQ